MLRGHPKEGAGGVHTPITEYGTRTPASPNHAERHLVRYRWLMVVTPGRSANAFSSAVTIIRSLARAVAAISRS